MNIRKIIKYFLIILFMLVIWYHFLVIFSILDYKNSWWWRLETKEQMYVFESISIFIFCLVSYFYWINLWYFTKNKKTQKFSKNIMWLFFIIFFINTIWNLFAKEKLEMVIATPITFLLTLISLYFIKN